MFKKFNAGKVGLFVAGLAFGTAGIKILTSKDAKKVYTGCTAAVLRAKDTVVKTATTVQENEVIFLLRQNRSMLTVPLRKHMLRTKK